MIRPRSNLKHTRYHLRYLSACGPSSRCIIRVCLPLLPSRETLSSPSFTWILSASEASDRRPPTAPAVVGTQGTGSGAAVCIARPVVQRKHSRIVASITCTVDGGAAASAAGSLAALVGRDASLRRRCVQTSAASSPGRVPKTHTDVVGVWQVPTTSIVVATRRLACLVH